MIQDIRKRQDMVLKSIYLRYSLSMGTKNTVAIAKIKAITATVFPKIKFLNF